MTAWTFIIDLNKVCFFMSRERRGRASNSELKRWLENKAVRVNGESIHWNDEMVFPVVSFVLFPKNPSTLF